MVWGMSRSSPRQMVRRKLHGGQNHIHFDNGRELPIPSKRKHLAHRTPFPQLSVRIVSTPGNADTEQSLQ